MPVQPTSTSCSTTDETLEALRRDEEIFDGAFTIDGLDTDDETAAGPTGHVQPAVCTRSASKSSVSTVRSNLTST
jgi:hypothetical protein